MSIDKIGTLRRIRIAIEANHLHLAVIQALAADIHMDLAVVDGIVDAILVDTTLLVARLTAARAGYLDELAAANLPSDIDDLLTNAATIEHHEHSRSRVYPQDTQSTIALIASNAAPDTFGAWTEIIPINTIGFVYEPVGVQVEETTAAATYMIQLGYSIVDGSDPTTAQIMGERRIVMLGTPIKSIHDKMDYFSFEAPENAKLWGRVKSSTGDADEIDISVVILRHSIITNPVVPLTTWPWAV